MSTWHLPEARVRRVAGRWHAFAGDWSTALGDITVEEILRLFRSSTVVFLQPVPPPSRSKK
ncbi:MAG TPA: hypothetical protein VJ890_21205 [Vineibacter sp.]|nr:hypothetical protein [Vineibacter sp.]